MPPNAAQSDIDMERLVASQLVNRVEYLQTVESTNDHARALAPSLPQGHSVLVLAEQQTAGRGRGSNRWWTGPGSLAMSLLLDGPSLGIERRQSPLVSLAAATAIIEAVQELIDGELGLHWPNDVFACGRKLAGVLVETLPDGRQILGVGLNVNNRMLDAPRALKDSATTLRDLTGRDHNRTALIVAVLSALNDGLGRLAEDPVSVGQRANQLCLQHGRLLTVEAGRQRVAGVCAGIAPDGALLLDTVDGRRALYAGVLVKTP